MKKTSNDRPMSLKYLPISSVSRAKFDGFLSRYILNLKWGLMKAFATVKYT